MKILQVNDKFFTEGGTEVYIRQISQALKKQDHEVVIIYGEGPSEKELVSEGYKSYKVAGLGENDSRFSKATLAIIDDIIKEEKPDIVNLHNIQNAEVVAQFLRLAPTMRYVHDHRLICPGFSKMWYNSNQICPLPFSFECLINAYKEHCATRRPAKLLKKYHDKFYELAVNRQLPRILLASEFMGSQLIINKFNQNNFVVMPDFVELPSRVGPASKGRTILFVGRVTVEKGLQYIIRALPKINGAKLVVVGTGPQEKEYQELAKNLGVSDRIEFIGDVVREKIGKYYQEANVIAFTSIWPEPHGKIGPEAFSFGRPVVAFDSGGVSEWLQDGQNGYLVNRLDTDSLTEKLQYLLDNPNEAQKMGAFGRTWAEKVLNEKSYISKLLEVYSETKSLWHKGEVL